MNFIRNRNFRAGPQTSLEGFICPQNSDKQQKIKVFGRSGGVKSLNERFDHFCREGLKHYYRFMDNIFIMNEDKVFLRLMAELADMHLARDWKLSIN